MAREHVGRESQTQLTGSDRERRRMWDNALAGLTLVTITLALTDYYMTQYKTANKPTQHRELSRVELSSSFTVAIASS